MTMKEFISNMKNWASTKYMYDYNDVKNVRTFDSVLADKLQKQIDGFYDIKQYLNERLET